MRARLYELEHPLATADVLIERGRANTAFYREQLQLNAMVQGAAAAMDTNVHRTRLDQAAVVAKRDRMREHEDEILQQLRTARANLAAKIEKLTDENVSYAMRVNQLESAVQMLT